MTGAYGVAEHACRDLCWGVLFCLQERWGDASRMLVKVRSTNRAAGPGLELEGVAGALLEYIGLMDTPSPTGEKREARRQILLRVVKELESVLNPDDPNAPKLARECKRSDRDDKALDDPGGGYSRDPFREIDLDRRLEVTVAAIAYLLRAHATFFCRPRNMRDFNAAKVSLNDCFQCGQLGWRIYRSLPTCHAKGHADSHYLDDVINSAPGETEICCGRLAPPEESAYFIWSMLSMLEMQRANVYKQIDYLDEALRYYRHAYRRLERIAERRGGSLLLRAMSTEPTRLRAFVTPSVVRGLFEMSKVQFDLGYFAESLRNQVLCLAYLVETARPQAADSGGTTELRNELSTAVDFLEAEGRQSVLDTEAVARYFGYPLSEKPTSSGEVGLPGSSLSEELEVPGEVGILPERFSKLIDDDCLELACDILAQVGFTMFTLRGQLFAQNDELKDNRERWLLGFFKACDIMTRSDLVPIEPSPRAMYYRSLIESPGQVQQVAWDSPDKQLAHRLRECTMGSPSVQTEPGLQQFSRDILRKATSNMLEIITTLRRRQNVLMRNGYRFRRARADLSKRSVYEGVRAALDPSNACVTHTPGRVQDKFVVLRRWQSVNPKIPSPGRTKLRGGGYFLLWAGKGIVIDPGYDFIQNFYDEGFSLGDVHAVVVTHSHPDHDDELSTLTTLVREWNECRRVGGVSEAGDGIRKIDFFLNESTNLKFSAWLKASQVRIGRVVPLPSTWWDKDSLQPSQGALRGEPVVVPLRGATGNRTGSRMGTGDAGTDSEYSLDIEIVPAWHDDVIGRTEAIGLKFHLYDPQSSGRKVGILGYTGDTGAYGYDQTERNLGGTQCIVGRYADCDILVAHLGDVRIRELMTNMKIAEGEQAIGRVFSDWFPNPGDSNNVTPSRVGDFLRFLVALDLVPSEALMVEIELSKGARLPVSAWIERELVGRRGSFDKPSLGVNYRTLQVELEAATKRVFLQLGFREPWPDTCYNVEGIVRDRIRAAGTRGQAFASTAALPDARVAWTLLAFLCAFSTLKWQYPFHLGILGIHELFMGMIQHWSGKPSRSEKPQDGRLFVLGELPEELASYRHVVARELNYIRSNQIGEASEVPARSTVYAFTGDIGLHIGLEHDGECTLHPKIRCAYCNYNNETVLGRDRGHYHEPSKIQEASLKRLDSAMIYLCTEHDHHPSRRYFLSRPNLRVV